MQKQKSNILESLKGKSSSTKNAHLSAGSDFSPSSSLSSRDISSPLLNSKQKDSNVDLSRYNQRFLDSFKSAATFRKQAQEIYQNASEKEECFIECQTLLKQALEKINEILLEGPSDFQALFFSSQVHLDLAIVQSSPSSSLNFCEIALKKAELSSKSNLIKNSDLSHTWALIGMISILKGEKCIVLNELENSETTLLEATEAFQKCLTIRKDHPVANELIHSIAKQFRENPRHRERTGNAIYFTSGELIKQGGSYKNWKTRWLVCDDSCVTYWLSKKEWENGPVAGKHGSPKGQILWNEIVEVTFHEGECHNIHNRPKSCTKLCLHILTKNRTYNIIGFQNKTQLSEWFAHVKRASRLSKAKTFIKKHTTEQFSLVQDENNKVTKRESNLSQTSNSNSFERKSFFYYNDLINFKFPENVSTNNNNNNNNNNNTRNHSPSPAPEEREEPPLSSKDIFGFIEGMKPELQRQLAKQILEDLESQGHLTKLLMNLLENNPTPFLETISDISSFKIAKFGVFNKILRILETPPYILEGNRDFESTDDDDSLLEDLILPPAPKGSAPTLPSVRTPRFSNRHEISDSDSDD